MDADTAEARAEHTGGRPPGPAGGLVLGSMREIEKDSLGFFVRGAQRYGDVYRFRMLFWKVVFINHPEPIQRVLQDNDHNYDKATFDYDLLRPVVGNGLLTSDGDFWFHQRRLVQPAFHRKKLAGFADMISDEASAMVGRWRNGQTPEPFKVADEMTRLTLGIAGRAFFGLDLEGEANQVGPAFTQINQILQERFYAPLVPLSFPTPTNRRFRAAMDQLYAVVNDIIEARRRHPGGEDDVLSLLLSARDPDTGQGMDNHQIRDEVMTLMLAGHETTANALSWTLYLLARHPKVRHRLEGELDEVLAGRPPAMDDLPRLVYTEQVVHEALRLYPPAWAFSRRALAPDQLGGYRVDQGSTVMISPYALHRHPAFWPDPERFDPDRFVPSAAEGRPRYAYIPFGGGPRLCLGRDFALMEARLVLGVLLQACRLDLPDGATIDPEPLITLRPAGGLPMHLTFRDPG